MLSASGPAWVSAWAPGSPLLVRVHCESCHCMGSSQSRHCRVSASGPGPKGLRFLVRACIGSRLCCFPHESRLLVRAPSLRGLYIYLVGSLILVTSLFVMRIRRPHRLQHHTLAQGGRWEGKSDGRVQLLVSLRGVQCYFWARSTSRSMDPMSSVPELLFDHTRRLLGIWGSGTP